jgi:hypothetical protein
MTDWQPIETAPKGSSIDHPWIVLACFYEHVDEDGEKTGDVSRSWQHVGTWFLGKWQTLSGGFEGIGPNAWMPLRGNPTHWMPLPPPPKEVKT